VQRDQVTFEFHVSRLARDLYQFDQALFTITGNVVFTDFHAVRDFSQRMNERRDLANEPERAVKPGELAAMGLIDEILHYLVELYREQVNPAVMRLALEWLERRLDRPALDRTLHHFADRFPTVAVYRGDLDLEEYLRGETAGVPNRQIVLEELLLLWLANINPAFGPFGELFDDQDLVRETAYRQLIDQLRAFFETQPPFGPEKQNLIDALRAPALSSPDSLEGQLAFILERWGPLRWEASQWGPLLGQYVYRLLSGQDLLKEERKLPFLGPGPIPVTEFAGLEAEPEAFSPEGDWMPSLVLIAKNIYVWLDQLARIYQRPINRLDQIPDEELDRLARWGVTGLWLIGVWERSSASQRVKQLTGNPDAVASAYSLYDYTIAGDLGGEAAYQNLKARAWQRGIRMASDMVPNHVGIYSRWVVEHPDWFVARDDNPYPWYTYSGPDLSEDSRVGIFIEDHYFTRSDAAVVFKRVDRWTGQTSYVYHGNDGTSMPWNDTAQLNYLNPATREAVIQTILHVARQFPVIRFDAAMTLAKRHFQRLWFPEPGTGGAIPTRSEQGLSREQFNAAMPQEFWREVVDRVAVEAPGTLLLAEAFWLLEGYFVRTLGMHRVYNSAFMNMLRDEENAKYRQVIKNTIEFDPEVLRRFVNFMNNPDERTAVDQFGKDDKYFGICTLLVTTPGLPMLGHGQVEGFTEKYGMEFRRANWVETPDQNLIERHEREIFPLMHRRRLFAGVDNFRLFDLYDRDGTVNEDVYAYANRLGEERALVVYHNAFREASGWIRESAAFAQKTGVGDEKVLVRCSLAESLGLADGDDWFSILRDERSGLEYLRSNALLRDQGLYLELGAYRCQVFLDPRQVRETAEHPYRQLAAHLDGRGVPSIDDALGELRLELVRRPFEELVNADLFGRLIEAGSSQSGEGPDPELLTEVEVRVRRLAEAAQHFAGGTAPTEPVVRASMSRITALLRLVPTGRAVDAAGVTAPAPALPGTEAASETAARYLDSQPLRWVALLGWAVMSPLGGLVGPNPAALSRAWFDNWRFDRSLGQAIVGLGLGVEAAGLAARLTRALIAHERSLASTARQSPGTTLGELLEDGGVRELLEVNRHQGVDWFSRERFNDLVGGLLSVAVVLIAADATLGPAEAARKVATCHQVAASLREAERRSGYQVEKLVGMET
jgi:glycosidase